MKKFTKHDKGIKLIYILISIVFTLSCSHLFAATYYCDPQNGSMSNDGSQSSPCSSLADVFNNNKTFNAGDVIYVLSGHHGSVTIHGNNTGHVVIQSLTGHNPTFKSVSFSNASYWTIKGFTISPETSPEPYEKIGLLTIGGNSNIIVDSCEMYSVDDVSSWTDTDWVTIACSGINIEGDNNIIRNCIIRNIGFGIGIEQSANNNLVEYTTIKNFAKDASRVLGDYNTLQYNVVMDNYNVDDNHDDAFQSYSIGDGWSVGTSTVYGCIIRGNIVIETTDPSRPYQGPLQGIGNFDGMFEDWLVENNVIICTAYEGIGFYGAVNCKVINNTVIDPNPVPALWIKITAHKDGTPSTGNVVRNNLTSVMANDVNIGIVENNLIVPASEIDNFFVDFANFDCHLKIGAIAIDAGTSVDAPSLDLEGNARPNGNGFDIGAYEYMGENIEPASVTVSPQTLTLDIEQSSVLTYEILPSNATVQGVNWTTSDNSIAHVDEFGKVTGVSPGTATITATTIVAGKTSECIVSVNNSAEYYNVALFKSVTATGEDYPANIAQNLVDGSTLNEDRWSADPMPQSAEIDLGTDFDIVGLEVFTYNARTYLYTIDVKQEGGTYTTVVDRSNNPGGTQPFADNVTVTARYVKITVTGATDYSGTWASINELRVIGYPSGGSSIIPVEEVVVSPATFDTYVSKVLELDATVYPLNATNKSCTWTTSDATKATVDQNGVITAIGIGSCTITATSDDTGVQGTCVLSITGEKIDISSVAVSPDNVQLEIDGTSTLTAVILPTNASEKGVTWSSANPSIATVDENGIVTAISAGDVIITVTTDDGGFTSDCLVSVSVEPGGNIAFRKPVTVSSEPQIDYRGKLLVDGSIAATSRWSADGYPQWAVIDLGNDFALNRVDLYPNSDRDYQYTIEVMPEGGSYVTVVDRSSNTEQNSVLTDSFSAAGRYVRITVSGAATYTGTWVSLNELMVYGTIDEIPVTGVSVSPTILSLSSDVSASTNPVFFWDMETEYANIYTPGSDNSATHTFLNTLSTLQAYEGISSLQMTNEWATTYFDNNSNDVVWSPVSEGTIELYWQYQGNWPGGGMIFQITGKSEIGDPLYDTNDGLALYIDGEGVFRAKYAWIDASDTYHYVNASNRYSPITVQDDTWYKIRVYYKVGQGLKIEVDGQEVATTSNTLGQTKCVAWHQLMIGNDTRTTNCLQYIDNISVYDNWLDGTTVPQTFQLTETVAPANADNKTVTWTSSDVSVATVDTNGVVSALSSGQAIVTVTTNDGGYTANCAVTVNGGTTIVDVTGISVSPESLDLIVGQTSNLIETIVPSSATNQSVVWSSDNTAVATVDASGVVSALADGQAIITVTTNDGGFIATCDVNVSTGTIAQGYVETFGVGTAADLNDYTGWDNGDPIVYFGESSYPVSNEITNILTSDGYEGASGGSYALVKPGYNGIAYFQIEGINTSQLSDITLRFGFAAESGTAVTGLSVLVSTDGTNWITLGDSTVTTTATEWSVMEFNNIPAAVNLRVRFEESVRKAIYIDDLVIEGSGSSTIPVSSVSVNPTTLTLDEGQTSSLTMTILPANASDQSVAWSSSDEAVATVDASGLVTAVSAGNATITVTTNDGGYTATCDVVVNQSVINVTSISVSPTTLSLNISGTETLTQTITPSNATDQSVVWTSSNTAVATVDASGLVSAVSAGNATITVTTNDGGYTVTCDVNVSAPVSPDFIETAGTGTASTIAEYTGWDNDVPIVFSGGNQYPGVNEIESSHPSDTYQGASGGSNVHLRAGYNGTGYFIVEGINTSGLGNPVLTFGIMYNSVTGKDNFGVFVSDDGVNWTELSDGTFPSLSTWGLMTYENIPSATNLRIKFEVAARKDIWIDDIIVSEDLQKSITTKQTKFEIDDNLKISVYPNPVASNDFKVAIDGLDSNEELTLSIFDITGKILYKDSRNTKISSMGHSEISIKNTFRKGMYILKIDNGKITQQTKFIVR